MMTVGCQLLIVASWSALAAAGTLEEASAPPPRRLSKGGLGPTRLAALASGPGHVVTLETELPDRLQLTSGHLLDGFREQESAKPAFISQHFIMGGAKPSDDVTTKGTAVSIVFGVLFIFLALPIQWFNEERSARVDTLIARGLNECQSIECDKVSKKNFGCLVHVQGTTRAAVPVMDAQFHDVRMNGCLKLQSTIEVFEWTQTLRTWTDPKTKRNQPRAHREWTTHHQDSARFRKPSPENPRLPSGIMLGTFTQACSEVELGAFTLTEDMLKLFHKFEPAMEDMPDKVHAAGLTFFKNPSDGYFYARPGFSLFISSPGAELMVNHEVGDLRARFMRVPEGDATIVAVQCDMAGHASFVPYRPIARGPCISDSQERQKQVEEGIRPLKDLRGETGTPCCTGGVATCCCCPCNSIACCCVNEIVTEEIFYISEGAIPLEKPFQKVVARNPFRVWNFRLLGWGVMYCGMILSLGPFNSPLGESPGLSAYGNGAAAMLSAILMLASASFIVAVAHLRYRPWAALKWLIVAILIIVIPIVASNAHHTTPQTS